MYRSYIARVSLVYRLYITADGSRALNTSSTSTLVVCSLSARLYFIIEYESNIGPVSGYHRVEVVTKFEKLVVAVIVSAVFFATPI